MDTGKPYEGPSIVDMLKAKQAELDKAVESEIRHGQGDFSDIPRTYSFVTDDNRQYVQKLRRDSGLPHGFIIPRLDKKGKPVR